MVILICAYLCAVISIQTNFNAPETNTIEPPIFATFYYPWYGNPEHDGHWAHWNEQERRPPEDIASDFHPLLGLYSNRDQSILDQHMKWIDEAGLDLVITAWKGKGHATDEVVPRILAAAAKHDLKVAFHIEPYAGRTPESVAADVAYIYANYGDEEAFFRTHLGSPFSHGDQNRGIFFLWDPDFRFNKGLANNGTYWKEAIDRIHAQPEGGIVLASVMDPAWTARGHFDGGYSYFTRADSDSAQSARFFYWAQSLPREAWFVPSVTPGLSCRRIGYHADSNISRDRGSTYNRQWREILSTGVTPHMITVTTFNEWHEGTMIEPAACGLDDGQGYQYDCYALGPFQYLIATAAWTETIRQLPNLADQRSVSIKLGEPNTARGLYQRDLPDGLTQAWAEDGQSGRRTVLNHIANTRYLYFWVSDNFHRAKKADLRLKITYRDDGPGNLEVEYDATEVAAGGSAAYTTGPVIILEGTGKWKTAVVDLPNAFLDNRQNRGADFRITGRFDFIISNATLLRAAQ